MGKLELNVFLSDGSFFKDSYTSRIGDKSSFYGKVFLNVGSKDNFLKILEEETKGRYFFNVDKMGQLLVFKNDVQRGRISKPLSGLMFESGYLIASEELNPIKSGEGVTNNYIKKPYALQILDLVKDKISSEADLTPIHSPLKKSLLSKFVGSFKEFIC